MKLICTLTGAQVETSNDVAAKKLLASGGFAVAETEEKPKKPRRSAKKAE